VPPPTSAATPSIRQAHQSRPGSSSLRPRPAVSPMKRISATYIEAESTAVVVIETNAMKLCRPIPCGPRKRAATIETISV
jgi:hypothetical protein